MEQDRKEFLLAEFGYLTNGIAIHLEQEFKLERTVLTSIFAVYAWFYLLQVPAGVAKPLWILGVPVAIVLFGATRSAGHLFTLVGIYARIKEIEVEFLGKAGGWQVFVVERYKNNARANTFRASLIVFWAFAFAVTIAIALWHPL